MNDISLKKLIPVKVVVFLVISLVSSNHVAAEQNQSINSFSIPGPWSDAVRDVTARIKYPELTENNLYRLGITVNESILHSSDMATRKSHTIGESGCKDKSWIGGSFSFNADFVVNNPEPLPTELPEARRISLIEKCREWGKSETETEEYLERTLESYRQSKQKIVKGQLNVKIVNAPSEKAAFEYLLIDAILWSSAMPDMMISFFDEQCAGDLKFGSVAYCKHGVVRFTRDNIAVVVSTHGEFGQEALDIAKKIDAMLLQQPLLTYEQLQARCPRLHIGPGKKTVETDIPFLEYSVESPAGVQAWVRDIKINGQGRARQDHKIFLEEKPQMVQVQATVVSDELLVSAFDAEIEFPE